ncbi:DegV family protein [Fodinicola feengrottensis]
MEYLRRGGRIGAAAALVGTALAVKPILRIDTGGVTLAERVRTSARARPRPSGGTGHRAGRRPHPRQHRGPTPGRPRTRRNPRRPTRRPPAWHQGTPHHRSRRRHRRPRRPRRRRRRHQPLLS